MDTTKDRIRSELVVVLINPAVIKKLNLLVGFLDSPLVPCSMVVGVITKCSSQTCTKYWYESNETYVAGVTMHKNAVDPQYSSE